MKTHKIYSVVDSDGFIWEADQSVVVDDSWEGYILNFKIEQDGSVLAVVIDQEDNAYDVEIERVKMEVTHAE